ncbi:MAG: hypothetical protein HQL57_08045 [Magnetococcales bacterium]|nr:hypothetical protein [Magnetococcales bacterium]
MAIPGHGAEDLFVPANSVAPDFPPWEYHLHSTWSDGSAPPESLVRHALGLGITRLIFTEHTEPGLVAGPGWFDRYRAELLDLRERFAGRIDLGIGLEAPAVDFEGGLLLDEREIAGVEFVLGAVHALPGHGWSFASLEPERAIDLEFKALLGLAGNPMVDAIAHPGGVCQQYVAPFPMELFAEVVRKATANGIAIELNPAYQSPLGPYLEVCRRYDARVSPGSNAHHPGEIGRAWRLLREL